MGSPTDLANLALLRLGEQPITDIQESPAAQAFYPLVRDVALSWAPWTFATTRQRLARLPVAPVSQYRWQYELPTQPYCLRVLDIATNQEALVGHRPWRQDFPYQREIWFPPTMPEMQRQVLLTDADEVVVRYIGRMHEAVWMPLFQEVVVLWLAKSLCQHLTGRAQLTDGLQKELLLMADRAVTIDGHQDTPDEIVWDTLYMDVRQAYYAMGWPKATPTE